MPATEALVAGAAMICGAMLTLAVAMIVAAFVFNRRPFWERKR